MRLVLCLGFATFGLACTFNFDDPDAAAPTVPRQNVTVADCFADLAPRSDEASIEIQRYVLSDDSAEIWRAAERVPVPFTSFQTRGVWLRTEPGDRGECLYVDGGGWTSTLIPEEGPMMVLREYQVLTGQVLQWRASLTMDPNEEQPAWLSGEYLEGGCDILPCGAVTACVLRQRADLICAPTP